MVDATTRSRWLAAAGAVLLGLAGLNGCAGTGQVAYLAVSSGAPGGPSPTDGKVPLKVKVLPFEDRRADPVRVGLRTHLGGGVTYFDLFNEKPAEAMARLLAEYLTQQGWQAWVAKPGASEPAESPDVTLDGELQDFAAHAKSKFGFTDVDVKVRAMVQARNADGSTARITLDGTGSRTVVWFSPEDVQALLNDVLQENLHKLLVDTKVENRAIRLR